jgi:hypothetical protein
MRNSIVLAVLIVALVGCGQAAERELTATEQAVAQARSVQADVYAPATFREAERKLAEARAAMEVESEKFLMSRSYDATRALLESAEQAAYRAFYEAKSRMDMAREDTAEVIRTARSSVESARVSLAKAVEAKGMDIGTLEKGLAEIEATLAEADLDLKAGNFREAREKGESVISKAEAMERTVASAL